MGEEIQKKQKDQRQGNLEKIKWKEFKFLFFLQVNNKDEYE